MSRFLQATEHMTPGDWTMIATPDSAIIRPTKLTSYHSIGPKGGPALAFLPNGQRNIQDANAVAICAAPELREAYDVLSEMLEHKQIAKLNCGCVSRAATLLARLDEIAEKGGA